MALTHTLVDDFNDNSIDTAKWPDNSGSVSESGGRAIVPYTTSYHHFASDNIYELTGSHLYVQVPVYATNANSMQTEFKLEMPGNNRITFLKPQGQLVYKVLTNNVEVAGGFVSTDHRWWCMREEAGTVYMLTSADGQTWTERLTVATPAWVDDGVCYVRLQAGHWDAGQTPSPASAEFDNLNTGAATPWAPSEDPPGFTVNIVGNDITYDIDASPTAGVTDYAICRRAGTSGTDLDPVADQIAKIPFASFPYTENDVANGDYEFQVFGEF